jgi:metal-responsive CopG/Arc/MetJ family transcriptional regulator
MSTQDRVPVTVRLSAAGLAEIDRMAEAEERDRSSMIRILLREAVTTRQQRKQR